MGLLHRDNLNLKPKTATTSIVKPVKPKQTKAKSKPKKKASHVKLNKPIFTTNLKIENTDRNALKTLADLGYAKSQKDALTFLIKKFTDGLKPKAKKDYNRVLDGYNRFDHLRLKMKKQIK